MCAVLFVFTYAECVEDMQHLAEVPGDCIPSGIGVLPCHGLHGYPSATACAVTFTENDSKIHLSRHDADEKRIVSVKLPSVDIENGQPPRQQYSDKEFIYSCSLSGVTNFSGVGLVFSFLLRII